MRNLRKHIPNTVTMLNLLSGSLSVVLAFSGDLILASWFIILAAFFDFMDGMLARWLNARSDIGTNLDSLADVISFGLAPSVILFLLISDSHGFQWMNPGAMSLIPYVSFLVVVASAYRLARFNSDPGQSYSFQGLPTPATGLFVASIPLVMNQYQALETFRVIIAGPYILVGIIILLSGLMVSRIPMISLKLKSISWKESWHVYILLVTAPLFIFIFKFFGIPAIICLYIILSLFKNT